MQRPHPRICISPALLRRRGLALYAGKLMLNAEERQMPGHRFEQPREVDMDVKRFDPELLYVECARCGQPVLWSPGDTTRILDWAGIDTGALDAKCMIVSDGCPTCMPGTRSFSTQVVRLRKAPEDRKRAHGAPVN